MQTRRDQVQAYRFQNRRALAALVTGRPNVVEPPMRRLTVTTISGVMIAILIAVGFAVVGLIKPTSGEAWKAAGAIIVENQSGARYVYVDGVLHPTLNFASAVLAESSTQHPSVVHVDESQLAGVPRGSTIGIPGLPDSVPPSSQLVTSPWTVCSRLVPVPHTDQVQARVSLLAGSDAGARDLPAAAGAVVQLPSAPATGGARFLLADGKRFAIGSATVAQALGLLTGPALTVGHAFLDAVPSGPVLQTPHLAGQGHRFGHGRIGGQTVLVGQLLQTGEDQYSLVLEDGVAAVTPLEAALLKTLPIGPGGTSTAPLRASSAAALNAPPSRTQWPRVQEQFTGLPPRLPPLPSAPTDNGGLCAVYRHGAAPAFAVPPSRLPAFTPAATRESELSAAGRVDAVTLPPGGGALVRSSNGSATTYLIAYPGEKFAAAGAGVLTGFGYGGVRPVTLPAQLISLIPRGPALDPVAARRSTSASNPPG